ncbi:MAG: tRNA (adenosine(37)-N6)-threonylcarbamoyltransferase complex transferase subunit TsaD [Bacteroidia bacterium]
MSIPVYLLAIESSCDDTSAAVSCDDKILANVTANQEVHMKYGGVVPELASRAHQQNIVPVVAEALERANVNKSMINGVAFTRGPGLLGSLLVGTSFAKSFALALNLPLIEVNHMQAHVLAHFIKNSNDQTFPQFPFLCLTVSGGHTQIVRINDYLDMEVIGETMDDAAGEAFDKSAKVMGLPYPGGPLIDQFAQQGDALRFKFPHPDMPALNYSFSGLKTSFMNFINKNVLADADFIAKNKNDICASLQKTIIDVLFNKLFKAAELTGIKHIAIAGGVSANSGLRKKLEEQVAEKGWTVFIPPFQYCTDNAGMIAIAGYYKFLQNNFVQQDVTPLARYSI